MGRKKDVTILNGRVETFKENRGEKMRDLKTLFNTVEGRFKKLLNFDICVV